jgi:hypothetical protein
MNETKGKKTTIRRYLLNIPCLILNREEKKLPRLLNLSYTKN